MTTKSPLLFALLLVLASASSDAIAGQPGSHCIGYYDTFEVVDCGDFSVMDDAMVFADIKDYCSKEGDFTRSHIKLTARDKFYRDPDGVSVKGTTRINDRADFDEAGIPHFTPAPIVVAVHAHGLGYMFLDVGMLEIDVDGDWDVYFSADRFSEWTPADFDALCAYFE